jgi:modulator of FtsH protease HflC
MPRNVLGLLIAGVVVLFGLISSAYVVDQREQAIVLRLGAPERIVTEPGLYFKLPFVENVTRFDKRIMDLDMQAQEVLSTDQLRLVVDAFARFRIVEPMRTYQSTRTTEETARQLSQVLASKLRDELGKQPFAALLSPERGQMMDVIQAAVNVEAKRYGAEIVDVRIKRADLPAGDPLTSAFERMRTAREQEARSIRATGLKQAELIRAEADSQAAKIYADSFGQDADFFAFYRSMQAYRQSMKKEDTTVVLSPDSEFLRQFEGRR